MSGNPNRGAREGFCSLASEATRARAKSRVRLGHKPGLLGTEGWSISRKPGQRPVFAFA
jgi:hypothetical protein